MLKSKKCALTLLAVVAIVVATTSISVPAYADSNVQPNKRYLRLQWPLGLAPGTANLSYTVEHGALYINNNGINANVKISVITSNPISRGADVRMLGRNGEVIWIERQAIGVNDERTFWCGSDVVHLQAKAAVSDSTLYPQALGSCDWVVYNWSANSKSQKDPCLIFLPFYTQLGRLLFDKITDVVYAKIKLCC